MILEGAIGDAYGAGFEFAERSVIDVQNNLTQYIVHPTFPSIYKKYTDDTQMAIALIELMIEGTEWNEVNIANKFVEVFKRDKREGYAKRFYKLLDNVSSGEELINKIIPKSERNGAAMRAYPVGLLKNENEILEKTAIQASVTHKTQPAIEAAQAIALITHFYYYQKGNKSQLLEYLSDIQGISWKANWEGEVEISATQTVEAVLTVLLHENTLSKMLLKSVDFGGDVDTVASLCLAIASLRDDVEKDLPQFLFDDLENETFGRDYLIELDKRLFEVIK